MAEPTVERRLERRFIVMTTDDVVLSELRARVPAGWEMAVTGDLEALGDWNDVLLYRFVLLDLDESDVFDPLDVIRLLRMRYMINIPVLCFGGDEDIRDEMRLARADRFFERNEIVCRLPQFLEQFGWTGKGN
jgi:hypothetical protein